MTGSSANTATIANSGGTLTISNSTIAGNFSRTAAGAISGSATLTNSILVGNGLNCSTGGTITLRRADDLCLRVVAGVLGSGGNVYFSFFIPNWTIQEWVVSSGQVVTLLTPSSLTINQTLG
jgi:hypothetical protein